MWINPENKQFFLFFNITLILYIKISFVTMRFENASFPRFFLVIIRRMLPEWLARMHCARKIITVSNTRAPKMTDGDDCRRLASYLSEFYTDPYQIEYSAWHECADRQGKADRHRKSPNGENHKKYKAFKITTKIVEHCNYVGQTC